MLLNLPVITTSELIDRIVEAFHFQGFGIDGDAFGITVIAYGDAGCGKTYAGRVAADKVGAQFATLYAMQYSPTDVAGARTIPLDGGDALKHYLPEWFADEPGLRVERSASSVASLCSSNRSMAVPFLRRAGFPRTSTQFPL